MHAPLPIPGRFTRSSRTAAILFSCCALSALIPLDSRADAILQYFEGRHATIERRMPDIFMAGYRALWLPPPGRADSGNQSVGYDVFDRFDLGSRSNPTLYGTEAELRALIEAGGKAGVLTYVDLVLNHNGFSDLGRPGFIQDGDYPGFVLTLPNDIDGDFHGRFAGGDLDGRLAGLIDIAHEKNNRFIRHPVDSGDSRNIPNEPARASNRRFYPDSNPTSPPELGNTSGDRHSPSGFNLDRPLAGDPVVENANDLLLRHARWMVEVMGVDGFRLDAAKHVPTFFWNDLYDPAMVGIGPGGSTSFSFGEVFSSDFGLLGTFMRKDGFGNRDVLDFPLFFTLRSVLEGQGFGDMRQLEFASFDGSDGNANDGSRGVMFASSHDEGGAAGDNLGHAHILTRPGYPVVYFNAKEFGDGRDFPKDGRGDALGGRFGERIIRLVDIHNEYGRGAHLTRWTDGDVYVYERDRALLVGLNDNRAFDANRTVQTSYPGGTTLVELTGNPRASNPLVVNANGTANLTIPHNGTGLGYALWGLKAPRGADGGDAFTITPVSAVIPPDPPSLANGVRRLTPIERVAADSATLALRLADENLDDNALVRIDDGAVNIIGTTIFQGGASAGFQPYQSVDPGVTGQGRYSANLDLSRLSEGHHFIESRAFLRRDAGQPAIFETFRKVIYVDRQPPEVALRFPTRTGNGDVRSADYEVVLQNGDRTADSVHVLPDFSGTDAEAIAAVGSASQARQVDRDEHRFRWTGIGDGLHQLTVIAFESSGNLRVARFDNIDAAVGGSD